MKALIIVDIQNDFCTGGALAVPDAEAIIPVINTLSAKFDTVIATKDYHPAGHASFASSHEGKIPGDIIDLNGNPQTLWPDHCVRHTDGADFHPTLDTANLYEVIYKGTTPEVDSYSAFFDNDHITDTALDKVLKSLKVKQLFICGLATDYCVKATALDAVELGYITHLVTDACSGVELNPGDAQKAIGEMTSRGVIPITSAQLLK